MKWFDRMFDGEEEVKVRDKMTRKEIEEEVLSKVDNTISLEGYADEGGWTVKLTATKMPKWAAERLLTELEGALDTWCKKNTFGAEAYFFGGKNHDPETPLELQRKHEIKGDLHPVTPSEKEKLPN